MATTGRPPKYKTPEEMEEAIDRYFEEDCPTMAKWSNGVKYTIPCPTLSGLALYLGFADRHSMYAYEAKPQFSNTIKKARSRITQECERLAMHTGSAGAIFMMKNLGYTDKQQLDVSARIVKMGEITLNGKKLKIDIAGSAEGAGEADTDPNKDQ